MKLLVLLFVSVIANADQSGLRTGKFSTVSTTDDATWIDSALDRGDDNIMETDSDWDPLIAGGRQAAPEAYPSMVTAGTRSGLLCGTTLIHPKWLLTAAHCADAWKVGDEIQVGTSDRASTRRVTKFFKHPQYDSRSITNDIMMPELDSFIFNIVPVRVESNTNAPKQQRSPLTVVGFGRWGSNHRAHPKLYELLLKADSDVKCSREWGRGGRFNKAIKFCAKARPIDSCGGYSGGPIFDARTKVQVGLVSYASTDCDPRKPGVYTRIASCKSWINEVIIREASDDDYSVLCKLHGSPCKTKSDCCSSICGDEGVC